MPKADHSPFSYSVGTCSAGEQGSQDARVGSFHPIRDCSSFPVTASSDMLTGPKSIPPSIGMS